MSITAGLDVGSAYTKGIVLSDGVVLAKLKMFQGPESVPVVSQRVLDGVAELAGVGVDSFGPVAVTGMGKQECAEGWVRLVEGMCLAKAASRLNPAARVVLDIGSEKALAVRCLGGKALKFSRNEQCAGGTGRFLEMAAGILRLSLVDLDESAAAATGAVEVQSVCAVFAESELLSQIHVAKASVEDLAAGVLKALANRLFPLIARVGLQREVLLAGGVSQNKTLRRYLEELMGFPAQLPEDSEYLGAFGAALVAAEGF